MAEGAYLYMLRCADQSIYIGTTRTTLEVRLAQHNSGELGGYTSTRTPVVLMHCEWFERITDAIAAERQVKRWTRAKKEAFARGDFAMVTELAARRGPHGSRRAALRRSSP